MEGFLIPRDWEIEDQEGIRLDPEHAAESGTLATLMLGLNAFGALVNSGEQVISFNRHRLDILEMLRRWRRELAHGRDRGVE